MSNGVSPAKLLPSSCARDIVARRARLKPAAKCRPASWCDAEKYSWHLGEIDGLSSCAARRRARRGHARCRPWQSSCHQSEMSLHQWPCIVRSSKHDGGIDDSAALAGGNEAACTAMHGPRRGELKRVHAHLGSCVRGNSMRASSCCCASLVASRHGK